MIIAHKYERFFLIARSRSESLTYETLLFDAVIDRSSHAQQQMHISIWPNINEL